MSQAAHLPEASDHIRDPQLRSTLAQVKRALADAVGPSVRLILFGSRARGDAEPDADVDLMVILPDEAYTFTSRQAVYDVVADVSLERGYLIVPIIVSERMARDHAGFMVFGAVDREGLRV